MNFNCWPFYNATNSTIIPSVGDNINSKLCGSGSCKKKKKNIGVPIVASLGGLLILSLIVAATLLGLRRKRQHKTKGENTTIRFILTLTKKNSPYILTYHAHDDFSICNGRY